MDEEKNQSKEAAEFYKRFFEKISALNGISPLWEKVLDTLKKLDPTLSDCALDVFSVYFSLLDDGNTCIPLEQKELLGDWLKKWNGLLLVAGKQEERADDKEFFAAVVQQGLREINERIDGPRGLGGLPFNVFCDSKSGGKKYLFAQKYFKAKAAIEERVGKIFTQKKNSSWSGGADECERVKKYFCGITSKSPNGKRSGASSSRRWQRCVSAIPC